jgi:hypothetical protein
MIAISTPTFDIDGSVVLRHTEKSDLGGMTRRSSVVATIDGGSVPQYRGYSVSDRTLTIVGGRVPPADIDRLGAMVSGYNELIVSTAAGCFLCAVYGLKVTDLATLSLQVVEEL